MQRSLIQIYAAAVCFAAAVCMSISAGVALYSLVQLSAPELTSRAYRSDPFPPGVYAAPIPGDPALAAARGVNAPSAAPPPPTEQQLREARERAARWAIENERGSGIRGLLRWGIAFLVGAVLWMLHWRILRREGDGSGARSRAI